jgi:hypothetical protein
MYMQDRSQIERVSYLATGSLLSLFLALSLPAADPPGKDEWKYDVVHRKKGLPLRGLVIEQGAAYVRIKCIVRRRGSPTVVFTESVPRRDIEKLELLGKAEREKLAQRLEEMKRQRAVLEDYLKSLAGKGKSKLAEALDLRPAQWPPDKRVKGLRYESTHFHLLSNARAEVVQLAAIQLEQVYAAYARLLPPRVKKGRPTTVLLTRSRADYQALVRKAGLNLFNPAYYDPEKNQVVCGSDLERLCDERERVRHHHAGLTKQIQERKARLRKVYRGKVPAELLGPLVSAEKRILLSEKRNDDAFALVRRRFFQRLYHEAFHAYAGTFVYPQREGPLPVWLNEGLAQIFETATVEVGELRVGVPDRERLVAVRAARARGTLLPLADLLRSTDKNFRVAHAGDQQVSDRYYLASWALAFYLTFERKVLGTRALDEYVASRKRGTHRLSAFRTLVGMPLPAFEKSYLEYLKKLRADGTVK